MNTSQTRDCKCPDYGKLSRLSNDMCKKGKSSLSLSDVSFDLFVPKSFTVVPTCLGQEPRCCKPSFVEGFCVAESIRKACPIFCSNYTTSTETSSFSQTTGEVDNIFTISSSGHSNETSFQQRESSN